MTKTKKHSRFASWLIIFGPGLVVMLADTDASSIITAAQSGAVWGYKLLSLQFILMPILFIAQELTVRLGAVTHHGHAYLIKKHFGKIWAWVSVSTLLLSCVGAIITEFTGIASVGMLYGVSIWITVPLVVILLVMLAWTRGYRSVERVALAIGAFELVFFIVAWRAHPSLHEMLVSLKSIPLRDRDYLYLSAANIGAVIMPWMIFYQQSAVVNKGLGPEQIKTARWDTAIGAVITQAVMAAVLIATAATIGKAHPGTSLNTVQEISQELTPYLGAIAGKLLFSMGIIGASVIATIVVTLTAAWTLGELLGFRCSLQDEPCDAPWFYTVYILALILGAVVVIADKHLVALNVAVDVMNALLLPIVLGFLFLLAIKTLPEKYRLKGKYAWFVGILLGITALFGVYGGIF